MFTYHSEIRGRSLTKFRADSPATCFVTVLVATEFPPEGRTHKQKYHGLQALPIQHPLKSLKWKMRDWFTCSYNPDCYFNKVNNLMGVGNKFPILNICMEDNKVCLQDCLYWTGMSQTMDL